MKNKKTAAFIGIGILLLSWLVFISGYGLLLSSDNKLGALWERFLVGLPGILLIISAIVLFFHKGFPGEKSSQKHTEIIDNLDTKHLWFWILLASSLSLIFELIVIRFHSAQFQFFAYFKNLSLISCFLGLGIGFASGTARKILTPLFLPLFCFHTVYLHFLRSTFMAFYLQNPVKENLTLGMATMTSTAHSLLTYGFMILIFFFNAFCFIPLGQLVARTMKRKEKLSSYGWNLLGSFLGICIMTLLAYDWTPPTTWLIVSFLGLILFFAKQPRLLLMSILIALLCLGALSKKDPKNLYELYSPYQILNLVKHGSTVKLNVNNIYFQRMLNLSDSNIKKRPFLKKFREYYSLPYIIRKDASEVLIVGSGTGNDIASAIKNGAKSIDAVEIDPAIVTIGLGIHPEKPYENPRVNTIINDARAYLRYSKKKYDLIIYGLLDSHALLSGKSGGIRLDSYVYTVEAFREARKRLKKNGIICLTFCIISPELARKLCLMLEKAFDGRSPIIYKCEYDVGYSFVIGEGEILSHIADSVVFENVTSQFTSDKIKTEISTDDWPFFYMPRRQYPFSYLIMVLILVLLSFIVIYIFAPSGEENSFSLPCFFLGAGFMLVETKGITELALVFGSTWMVNSVIIGAILIMAYFANLLVMKKPGLNGKLFYVLLFVSIALGYLFSTNHPGLDNEKFYMVVSTILLTIPLFFSGIIFSKELFNSTSIGSALSANLFGAICGAFLEYNSMYFGFRSLYILAIVMYIMAFITSMKKNVTQTN